MSGSLSLLTDLDCSAKLQDLKEDAKAGRRSQTVRRFVHNTRISTYTRTYSQGTPMFIAMEISSDHVGWRLFPLEKLATYRSEMPPSNRSCSHLESLKQKVKEQLAHVRLAALTELKASISMMLSSNHSYLKQEAKEQLERELANILKEHFDIGEEKSTVVRRREQWRGENSSETARTVANRAQY